MDKNTIHLSKTVIQNAHELKDKLSYLDISEQCILDFQSKIRGQGYRTFNVWKYLENEFFKYFVEHKIDYRKPPKAVTINQWFRNDNLTTSKLGTQDLLLICKFIDSHIPLASYYDECIHDLIPNGKEVVEDLSGLNSVVLNMAKRYGDLAEEYDRSSIDKIIDAEEAARLIAFADAIKLQAEKIVSHLNLKKVS